MTRDRILNDARQEALGWHAEADRQQATAKTLAAAIREIQSLVTHCQCETLHTDWESCFDRRLNRIRALIENTLKETHV